MNNIFATKQTIKADPIANKAETAMGWQFEPVYYSKLSKEGSDAWILSCRTQ